MSPVQSQVLVKAGKTTGSGLSYVEIPLDTGMILKHVSLGIDTNGPPQMVNIVIIETISNHGLGIVTGLSCRGSDSDVLGVSGPVDFPIPDSGNYVLRGRVYDFGGTVLDFSLKGVVRYDV